MPILGAKLHTYNEPSSSFTYQYALLNGERGAIFVNPDGSLGSPVPTILSGSRTVRLGATRQANGLPYAANIGTDGIPVGNVAYGLMFSDVDTSGLASLELSVEAKKEMLCSPSQNVIEGYAVRGADEVVSDFGLRWIANSDFPFSDCTLSISGANASSEPIFAETSYTLPDFIDFTTPTLTIQHKIELQHNGSALAQQQVKVTVTLTNESGTPLNDVHYLRAFQAFPSLENANATPYFGNVFGTGLFGLSLYNAGYEVSLGVDSSEANTVFWVRDATGASEYNLTQEGWGGSDTAYKYVQYTGGTNAAIKTRTVGSWRPESGDTVDSTTTDFTSGAFQTAVHSALGIGSAADTAILMMSPGFDIDAGDSATFTFFYTFGAAPQEPFPPIIPGDGPRLYDRDGKRKRLPGDWINRLDFVLSERGGCLDGSVSLDVDWADLALDGTERLDIWLWGQILYRGWIRTPQRELSGSGKALLTTYGLMERLNGYLVRRCSCYGGATNFETIFLDLVAEYVTRSGRLPDLVIDTTGVAALGLTATEFCAKGKPFPEALNQLCDLAPNRLIWGCDVDDEGNDRLYLRPRATQATQVYAVGDRITGFVYPPDATEVVNKIYVTGGPAERPNLITNGSFEDCVPPGEATSLLLNGDFEINDGDNDADDWTRSGDPTLTNISRSGEWAFYLDNNPFADETLSQTVDIGSVSGLTASFWYKTATGGVNKFKVKIELLNSASTVLYSSESAEQDATADDYWHQFTYAYPSWPADPLIAKARVSLKCTVCTDDTKGFIVDDVSLYPPEVAVEGWKVGQANDGSFSLLQWINRDPSPLPVHGGNKVKAAAVLGSGGYVEIAVTEDARVEVKKAHPYVIRFGVQASGGTGIVRVGSRFYEEDGTLQTTLESGNISLTSGLWFEASYAITTGEETAKMEPFLRLYTNGRTYYIDAAGLFEGTSPPSGYYVGENFEGVKSVAEFSSLEIGADAVNSIDDWGEREAEVSVDGVRSFTELGAYAVDYFRANAVPKVRGRLTIGDAQKPLTFDGQVRVVNLPEAPAAMNVARAKYTVASSITIDADLNDERPDLALLLVGKGATR
jgi:hypothetical protein